jgi:hypothetical protein
VISLSGQERQHFDLDLGAQHDLSRLSHMSGRIVVTGSEGAKACTPASARRAWPISPARTWSNSPAATPE